MTLGCENLFCIILVHGIGSLSFYLFKKKSFKYDICAGVNFSGLCP